MSINLAIHNFKILAWRPVINRLKPMKTETGLKTTKNRGLRSFCGPVWSFDFWEKGRLVTVTVKALWHQKTGLDWTFKHYRGWLTKYATSLCHSRSAFTTRFSSYAEFSSPPNTLLALLGCSQCWVVGVLSCCFQFIVSNTFITSLLQITWESSIVGYTL